MRSTSANILKHGLKAHTIAITKLRGHDMDTEGTWILHKKLLNTI